MRLLLVRHGQTTSNIGHHLDTAEPGAGLSDLGRAQADAIPEALRDEHLDLIVVSNLLRTQQTAAPLLAERGMEPWVRPGIREISAGDLEMRNDHEAIETYIEGVFGWDEDIDTRVAGGETGREVVDRFDEVVAEVAEHVGDGCALLVSHGAVIRVWAALRCADLDLEKAADRWVPNTAMLTLEGSPSSGWTLIDWLDRPLGGIDLADRAHTGPGGETEDEVAD